MLSSLLLKGSWATLMSLHGDHVMSSTNSHQNFSFFLGRAHHFHTCYQISDMPHLLMSEILFQWAFSGQGEVTDD